MIRGEIHVLSIQREVWRSTVKPKNTINLCYARCLDKAYSGIGGLAHTPVIVGRVLL